MPAARVWPFAVDWRWPGVIGEQTMDTYRRLMDVVVPVSLIGLPCLCLPAGFGDAGLPTGPQLCGPDGGDRRVLEIGPAGHAATDWPAAHPPPAP